MVGSAHRLLPGPGHFWSKEIRDEGEGRPEGPAPARIWPPDPIPFPRPAAVGRPAAQLATVAIDAEEDFDWARPVAGTSASTAHIRHVRGLQALFAAYGIVPTYLLTYPVLRDPDAVRIMRRLMEDGRAALGVQLHPWVTPPLDDRPAPRRSYIGNLPLEQEEAKLLALMAQFRTAFGCEPRVYRAGRYGLSRHSPALLEKHGFTVDTSVAPRSDFTAGGGPDYRGHDCRPFWFGASRRLLEVPLCRSVVGWAGLLAPALYEAAAAAPLDRLRVRALLTRSRCAERITLSPEGNDAAAMRRLVRGLTRRGQPVLTVSFHSSSIAIGSNPYVRSRAELHYFYDRLSAILDHLAALPGLRFVPLDALPALLAEEAT